jgi:hypothetical protein
MAVTFINRRLTRLSICAPNLPEDLDLIAKRIEENSIEIPHELLTIGNTTVTYQFRRSEEMAAFLDGLERCAEILNESSKDAWSYYP